MALVNVTLDKEGPISMTVAKTPYLPVIYICQK